MKRKCGLEENEEETLTRLAKIDHCIDALADFGKNAVNMREREATAEVIDTGKKQRANIENQHYLHCFVDLALD